MPAPEPLPDLFPSLQRWYNPHRRPRSMAAGLSRTLVTPMVWEERWHPLRREWVIVSSHRNDRPWHGERVEAARAEPPAYAPDCYLCPGNVRVSGRRNDAYAAVYAFDNDHPCVGPDAPRDLP